jgi:glycosyltransferase involved in cell wall biosynthesis
MKHDLTIDARMIKHSGIGTYIKNMIAAIADNYNLTLLGNYDTITSFTWSKKIKVITATSPIYSLKEQIELPKIIPACDLFISPHYNVPLQKIKASKRAVIIHDVNHLTNINNISLIKRLYAKYMINAAIKKSDKIITISKFSKSEINKYTNPQKKDISITYCGLDSNELRQNITDGSLKRVRLKYNLPENYILFVGNMKPHKNIDVVIKAIKSFGELYAEMKLVIVGTSRDQLLKKLEAVNSLKLENKIVNIDYIENDELPSVYKNAKCLIFPSIYEGFGLPPIEAMICGCPVIAAKAASIPEVCNDAALYFNPNNENELIDNIRVLLKNKELCNELLQKGYKNAEKYSKENFRDKLIHIINDTITN